MSRLDVQQFKLFFSVLTHYWVKQKVFISSRNFFNLWCELNELCHEMDESFPDPYDRELIKSYCLSHPYYFIDILDLELIINLFCEYNLLSFLSIYGKLLPTNHAKNRRLRLHKEIERLAGSMRNAPCTKRFFYPQGSKQQKSIKEERSQDRSSVL